ncbi:hypothetical protein ALNOE001_20300 [Candidatus Methanobinarius endosymbioticus]|uniref:Uncharacterized protein n=1 Tax=Candidatus Methanobinarius endosymbioticus TaxID=2006182 RepID=A0A366M9A2_9EURY|nr:hypothetical protein ALNOE001_20300 [Candidatus Methanobinarius endosymbioticus]
MNKSNIILIMKNIIPNSNHFIAVIFESFFIYKNKNIEPINTRTNGRIVSNKGFPCVFRG